MILTVTPNPCVDKTVYIDTLTQGAMIRSKKYTCIPGGKGTNVSRAVKKFGGQTAAFVVVGGHTGRHVVEMIENQDEVECIPAWVHDATRTITTVLETSIHRQTAFFEPGPRLNSEEVRSILNQFRQVLPRATLVTFNGTVSDPAAKHLYQEMITLARARGTLTLLDAHGEEMALGIEAVPHMVKPNIAELEELCGRPLPSLEEIWKAMESLHQKGIELVVVSRGREPLLISSITGDRLIAYPPGIKEVNPVGSGDALVAAFAMGMLARKPVDQIAKLGCAAGAANAMTWDICHFSMEEVDRLLPLVRVDRLRTN